ncbi:DNA ligase D [Halalkalibacter okhensis]|uniref:DNA ligase (ATP) n=1 Tax=Halalkalibacter okhensis TaxID=333138 RepID=A0A0B0IML1_9BACI|nr:DNA ligase D [Halalkalibacter okhensis]KHF40871.1 ATP-dependent DNA ligase [Halalkalibacter okhensis]
MKPMLLSPAIDIPTGKDWIYETKFDGFRCLLYWDKDAIKLISRTGKELTIHFPEITQYCEDMYPLLKNYLPLTFDGELVNLRNNFQSHFSTVQVRGRMKNQVTISKHAEEHPCHFIVFDIISLKGEQLVAQKLTKRKQLLEAFFSDNKLQTTVDYRNSHRIQLIDVFTDKDYLWNQIIAYNGEGIVAKRAASLWENDKRTTSWLKIKNYRFVSVILTKYDKNNGYFHGAIYQENHLTEVVNFKHGLTDEEEKTLFTFFENNGVKRGTNLWELPPSICVDIACIDFDGKQLREPRFHAFNFNQEPPECTWNQMQRQLHPIPEHITITNPQKPIWTDINISKDDYLLYLQKASPYLLPFLRERLLTVIRYPHGAEGERFYQKHCPEYAPEFIETEEVEDINYIICNNIETLLWLGNQLALELHIPFQTRYTDKPTEIVFDLDPPSVEDFSLAVIAAKQMKAIFDQFHLTSFVKTSGGKGLQVYIPLPTNRFTYQETRVFTQFICQFLCEQQPDLFTTERLKKKRNNKLYLDYIQHDQGKTIVAPYSPRGSIQGLIATPLKWEDVTDSLTPDRFTLPAVIERLETEKDPFSSFREVNNEDAFSKILIQLKELVKP